MKKLEKILENHGVTGTIGVSGFEVVINQIRSGWLPPSYGGDFPGYAAYMRKNGAANGLEGWDIDAVLTAAKEDGLKVTEEGVGFALNFAKTIAGLCGEHGELVAWEGGRYLARRDGFVEYKGVLYNSPAHMKQELAREEVEA